VQRYSYDPFDLKVCVSVADAPGLSSFVTVPVHAFAVPPLVQILKSCGI